MLRGLYDTVELMVSLLDTSETGLEYIDFTWFRWVVVLTTPLDSLLCLLLYLCMPVYVHACFLSELFLSRGFNVDHCHHMVFSWEDRVMMVRLNLIQFGWIWNVGCSILARSHVYSRYMDLSIYNWFKGLLAVLVIWRLQAGLPGQCGRKHRETYLRSTITV